MGNTVNYGGGGEGHEHVADGKVYVPEASPDPRGRY